jgi:hypothetical protein
VRIYPFRLYTEPSNVYNNGKAIKAEQADILKIPIKLVYTNKDVAGMYVDEQLAKTGFQRRIDYYPGGFSKAGGN